MKNILLCLISLFCFKVSFAQQQSCNCDNALNNLITKIENEYPGFKEKTKDIVLYNSFKEQLKAEAKTTETSLCFTVLKKYTSFFRDGHIWINPATTINKQEPASTAFFNIDIDEFLKKPAIKHAIEGTWKNSFEWTGGVVYKIGITKSGNNEYTGFVITASSSFWKPKEVKFKLFANGKYEFYFFDKTIRTGTYEIYNNQIIYFKEAKSTFIKENSASTLSEVEIKRKVGEINGFGIKQLNSKTALITLPSFDYPFVDIINNLISDNRKLIESSENLIVDIRGNSGGTDNAYENLLPYIMTNSIRNMGVEYLVTPTLINGLENYIKTIKDNKEKQAELEMVKGWIKRFENKTGEFVNLKDSSFSTEKVDIAQLHPKNVIILTDKRVGSSAESFVMKTKQSKKVKVMGTVTSGGLDYAAARFFDFGCPEYMLQLPTYRSLRLPDYPIDNIGLQPDIYLDKSVKDWVQFALEYLEN